MNIKHPLLNKTSRTVTNLTYGIPGASDTPRSENPQITKTHTHGDMSLCNLASVNLVAFRQSNDQGKDFMCRLVVQALDDAITNGQCPIAEGNITNELYRYIGVGVLNTANAMALEGITIDSPEAAEWTDEVMEDLAYRLYSASVDLAIKRGAFKGFEETKWAEGLTPVHMSRQFFPEAWNLTTFGREFESSGRLKKWDELGQHIKENGIRHAQVMAIAPTANSGKAINATESTEPVMGMIFKEEGTFNVTSLAPNIHQNMAFYKPAFECDQKALLTNAIIRQKYLDQAQSITLYYKDTSSLKALTNDTLYAFENGIKTLYYIKQPKDIGITSDGQMSEDCVACAV